VMGVMYAIAKNKLPIHVIALAPSTDKTARVLMLLRRWYYSDA